MDLTVQVQDSILNIRVAVLIKTSKGYILEKHKQGYLFFVGGRVQINESSEDAAKREILEEIGVEVKNIKLSSIIENFFKTQEGQVHEICFVYTAEEINDLQLTGDLGEYGLEELLENDVRPAIMKDLLKSKREGISHLVCR